MSEGGYKIRNKEGIHFVTFAVVEWVDVFTVLDSIRYCQQEKGLILYGWCPMSNHIHLVVSAAEHNTSDVLRDFPSPQSLPKGTLRKQNYLSISLSSRAIISSFSFIILSYNAIFSSCNCTNLSIG